MLDFNNQTYAEFFRENGIDIDNDKYQFNGTSKMKRLRAFWEIEPDDVVGKVMEALLQYACVVENVNEGDRIKAIEIIHRLQGKNDIQDKDLQQNRHSSSKNFLILTG